MRVDFSSLQLGSDDVQQAIRLARVTRAVVASVVVGILGFAVSASWPPGASDRPLVDASSAEMQLFPVEPQVPPASAASAPAGEPTSAVLDEGLRSLAGVVHHG